MLASVTPGSSGQQHVPSVAVGTPEPSGAREPPGASGCPNRPQPLGWEVAEVPGGESRTRLCVYVRSSGLSCASSSRSGNCPRSSLALAQAEPWQGERSCRGEGWAVPNAVILPLFEYLHTSFNKTGFLKIKCPVEPGLWGDKCISVTSSYHSTASEQELSLGWR